MKILRNTNDHKIPGVSLKRMISYPSKPDKAYTPGLPKCPDGRERGGGVSFSTGRENKLGRKSQKNDC